MSAILLAACSRTPISGPVQNSLEGPANLQPPTAAAGIAAEPSSQAKNPPQAPTLTSELPPPQTALITAMPTAALAEPQFRQIVQGGCCPGAFWSPDSRSLLYIDRPDPSAPTGLWSVDVDGRAPRFAADRLGIYSPDLSLRAVLEGGETIVERVDNGQRWVIPNGGRAVSFSPDSRFLAWTTGQSGPPLDSAQRSVWISRFDGTQAQQIITVTGGGFSGWLGSNRILVNGRPEGSTNVQVLLAVNLPAEGRDVSTAVELARAERLRSIAVSPNGGWLVFLVTFSEDPARDGLWLVSTATAEQRKLDLFGAYRWRDENRLLIIPLQPGSLSDQVWQVTAANGSATALTEPAQTPFKIAGGDWSVSPDGTRLAFVSAADNNLWVLELP